MAKINASVSFDSEKGAATVRLELVGASEMEHELLAQFFSARQVALVPFNAGDSLESRFVISDPLAFPKAQRATDNRIRTRNGQPTVEQEEAAKTAKAQQQAERDKLEAAAKAAGFESYAEQQEVEAATAREDALVAKVAAKVAAAKPAEIVVDPKAPKQ